MDGPNVMPASKLRVTVEEARRAPNDPGRSTALMLAHGTMELRWFAPTSVDPQTPHDRDELYIIVSGAGVFARAAEGVPFDALIPRFPLVAPAVAR